MLRSGYLRSDYKWWLPYCIPEEIRLVSWDFRCTVGEYCHSFMTTQVGRQFALEVEDARGHKYLSMGREKKHSM